MRWMILIEILFLCSCLQATAQNISGYFVVRGQVVDDGQGKEIPFATVKVMETNIATITNSDGEFLLKIPEEYRASGLEFSCVGYGVCQLPCRLFQEEERMVVRLKVAPIVLPEVLVTSIEGEELMRNVFRRIAYNYSPLPNQMVGFYRERIRKNGAYISIAEAILDIYKSPYNTGEKDQARIYKGRRSTDQARLDTVLFKYQGGVVTALELDLVKNYQEVFSEDIARDYDFYCESLSMIGEKPNYVVVFRQKPTVKEALLKGKFYIDTKSLAVTKVEFSVNLDNKSGATAIFLRKKPAGMKVRVEQADYLIQFRQKGGRWYFQNSRVEIRLKCRWAKHWFNSNYSLISEMAVTDWTNETFNKFPRKERLSSRDIIVEKIVDFEDENYWENYNIIEPEQSLENAIEKLSRKLKTRDKTIIQTK